ncbi:MAG: pyrrolysine--tRNA(Pyl) ligase large subunit [Deltaproteobacteria bacterium]|nr:MAG: pyrrolysine--tRNA(Pyl) ligase large subunit [Deltaproteobacteria bacterium]RLC16540.1 MAG: pyrrolysine--tRNA(Pyl) ligase large subunit [Deltaproteobacteria bacterium]
MIPWTQTQTQRLNELNAPDSALKKSFDGEPAREKAYQALEKSLVTTQRRRLAEFQTTHRRPELCRLENKLAEMLTQDGFAQVTTPIIMSRGLLKKMSIDSKHPLNSQIFWLQEDKCLRPMLAPHLYYLLVDLLRIWKRPVRIFEIGPCFRKESRGSKHASEFTMLNLVEMGTPENTRRERIQDVGSRVATAAGVKNYRFETVTSEIYGDTIDIVAGKDGLEIASAAMGPHPLDRPWKINESWIGIGFGLERLLMASHRSRNLARFGRSLAYLDGVRLNI